MTWELIAYLSLGLNLVLVGLLLAGRLRFTRPSLRGSALCGSCPLMLEQRASRVPLATVGEVCVASRVD